MEKRKQHDVYGRYPCPAVFRKQLLHKRDIIKLYDASLSHVSHYNYRNDDLIGREAQNERHQYDAVHADCFCKGIEKPGAVTEQIHVSHRYVRH